MHLPPPSIAYAIKEEYDLALEDFDKCIELDPQHEETYAYRGIIYHNVKDDIERALKDYNRSISLNPDKSQAYYFRGMLYYDMYKKGKQPRVLFKSGP